MSSRTIGRIVGVLVLLAYAVYLTGGALVDSASGTVDTLSTIGQDQTRMTTGALLMLANSACVLGIGLLAFPVLRPGHQMSACAYLVARTVEAVMLAVGIVFLLLLLPIAREYVNADVDNVSTFMTLAQIAKQGNQYCYQIAMISVAIGGMLFCRVLFRTRLVPRFMAVWGLVGYAIFLVGMILAVVGHDIGVALSVPGGLFEVSLGLLLLVRGFPSQAGLVRDGDMAPFARI